MKIFTSLLLLFFSLFSLSQEMTFEEWHHESKKNIRLLPEYGNVKKNKPQKDADKEFIDLMMKTFETKREASDNLIETGFKYFNKNDVKTAMYRFNQAYLLDSKNPDIYWGFGAVYLAFEEYDLARKQYDKGLKLDNKNDKILVDYGTSYLGEYYSIYDLTQRKNLKYVDQAIEYFSQAYAINLENSDASFKLSVSYFQKDDCLKAKEYLDIAENIGNNRITDAYKFDLDQLCNPAEFDCSTVKTGKFMINDETSGKTIIERTEEFQIEANLKYNFKMKFSVTWIDECTYQLKSIEDMINPLNKDLPQMILTCRITEITENGYVQVSSSDVDSKEFEFELTRID